MNATKNPTIVYLRVSTAEQETDSQEHQVLEYCRVRGWQPPVIFRDAASGASSSRPGLEQMLAQVRAGGVHQVVTYKLDRLGRSLTHLAIIVGELQMRNVALTGTSQGIDTSKQNPVGQLQLGVLMAVAEFERALIKERTLAGLEVARRRGKRLGRPPLDAKVVRLIQDTAARLGHRVRAVAREIHAPPSTVWKVLSQGGPRANAPANSGAASLNAQPFVFRSEKTNGDEHFVEVSNSPEFAKVSVHHHPSFFRIWNSKSPISIQIRDGFRGK